MPMSPKSFRLTPQAKRQEKSWASRRDGRHDLYNLWMWRKPGGLRQQVLARDPLCVWCWTCFLKMEMATVADHITPHRNDFDLFADIENCQGLCQACHNKKTWVEMNHGKRTVVCGPPNSGKTTYVNRHKSRDATVWDADDIVKAMTGRGRGDWPEEMAAIIPAMLDGLARGLQHSNPGEVWLIVSDPSLARDIAEKIGAQVVVMERSATGATPEREAGGV